MQTLTAQSVEDAMYTHSPCGLRALTSWLEQRHKFTADELTHYLRELLGKQKVIHRAVAFGGQQVDLYGLAGTWSG